MILEGKITFLVNSDSTTIEITDTLSSIRFAKITLTPEQLSMALSRLYNTPCTIDVRGLDKIGKKLEVRDDEFPIGRQGSEIPNTQELLEYVQSLLSDGWIVSDTFSSRGSFFDKEGMLFVRARLRRWVDVPQDADLKHIE